MVDHHHFLDYIKMHKTLLFPNYVLSQGSTRTFNDCIYWKPTSDRAG